jgi:large conductance mechanosensitive channel
MGLSKPVSGSYLTNMKIESEVKDIGKAATGFVQEFKAFISRGNVVDLAVGVIIGAAFGQITTSLVKDVVMPPIGYYTSGIDFSSIKYVIQPALLAHDPKDTLHPDSLTLITKPEVAIGYGAFFNTIINFLIVAFAVFWLVKAVSLLRRKEAEAPAAPAAPTPTETLLTEIRDLLAKK